MFYDTAAKYAYVHIERKDGKLTATSIRYGDSIKEAEGSLLDRLIEFFTGGQESLTVTNTFSVVRISKTDLATSGELKGAVLTVTQKKDAGGADVNPDDAYTTTWTSDGEAAHEIYGLEDGTYELTEDQAPLGYDTAEKITFVIKDGIVTGTDDNTIVMSDKQNKTDIKISKIDTTNGEVELADAELTVTMIKNAAGEEVSDVIESWTSGGTAHEIDGLTDGTYTLTEKSAPNGYKKAESITFTIEGGKLVTDGNDDIVDGVVVMKDEQYTGGVSISKQVLGQANELAGAELTVTRKGGDTVLDSWTSDGTHHEIKNLTDGTYILTETSAPEGYEIAESIEFTMKEGKLVEGGASQGGVVTMQDALKKTDVSISKVDAADSKELKGAELTVAKVKDINGEEVSEQIDSWTSDGTIHVVEGLVDGTYVLTETSAPEGYKVAEQIEFVLKNGELAEDEHAKDGVVTMKDPLETATVRVLKTDVSTGKELEGATIQILDKDGSVAREWTSTKEPHVIEGLKTNEEYTLKETVAPDGYTLAGETTFTIDESGKVTSTGTISGEGVLLVEDQKTSITLSIADKEGKAIEGVELQILDEKGNVVAEWRSGKDGHTVEGLNPGEYTLKVVTGLDGYEDAAPITFTLEADGTVKVNGEEAEGIMMTTEKITVPPKPTYRFSDVTDPEHTYFNAINWAADKGITKGYSDGTFGINRSCTRGEMMMFLWRYAGKPAPKWSSKSPFKNVPKTHVFYKAVLWGYKEGITKGYSDGTFGINRNVSRGEAMMFLWRLKGKPAPKAALKSPFKDVPKTHVFIKAILWAYQKKITTGYTSGKNKGKYMINENCSRGQIVTFLYKLK